MASSDNGAGVVDCSVGSIVWVRRRNGSWWPGKILGPEELSAAHLMSPRSGTPVKLLGREDASVDWYNLEKSKRVKAFRCGEFDDCIARVESSQGIPPKKREKYARREDAILHALELEKELLEKRFGKSGCSSNGAIFKSSDAEEKEPVILSECSGYGNGKHVLHKSHTRKLESFIDEKSMDHTLYAQKVKEGTQPVGDEDNSEVIPRMRGLQDFGLRIAPSKQKLSSAVASNGPRKPECDDGAHALPSGLGNAGNANCRSPLDKKRKSHDILIDDSLVRRRDKRRPLIQVLRSSSKLPNLQSLQYDNDGASTHMSEEEQMGTVQNMNCSSVGLPGDPGVCSDDNQISSEQMLIPFSPYKMSNSPCPSALGEVNTPRSTENSESGSSEIDSLDLDDEEMVELSDAAVVTELEPQSLGISAEQLHHESMSNEESKDLALPSEICLRHPPVPVPVSSRVSKWKLKGKRNNRGLAKRPIDVTDRRVSRGSAYENIEERESNGHDEPGLVKKNFRAPRFGLDNRGYPTSKSIFDWEDLALKEQPVRTAYWEHSSYNYDPVLKERHGFGGRMKSLLIDVDLKVQSSYQREHVPMISLMSKLNGQAIVGHPIQIEALENGSSEILLSASDSFCSETIANDPALPPVWRTARRTANFRVKRSHPLATLGGDEISEDLPYADQKTKTIIKKSSMGGFGHKASMMGKNLTHASRSMVDKKYSRKPPKKMSLSSSQKIKTLSSIGAEQRLGNNSRHGNHNYQVDGLIKRESGPTAIACIPVKLVFSRLFEELVGRHQ